MKKPRGVFIAGNWKMNLGPAETRKFFTELRSQWDTGWFQSGRLEAALFPPALSIHAAIESAQGLPLWIGAQNAHWEKSGAFTGELSGGMLQEVGAKGALVGHSERRQFFGETDESTRKRAESLLDQGLRVILCVGETRAEREAGQTEAVVLRQLQAVLKEPKQGAARHLEGRLVIAYEPVWAIGTGLTATPAQAEEAHQLIRKHLWDRFGIEASGRTPLLYGGSVTPENITELLACPNVDGALVGGASVKPASLKALLEAGAKSL